MESIYFSMPELITITVFYTTIANALILSPIIWYVHKIGPNEKIPSYWKPILISSFALLNLGQLIVITSSIRNTGNQKSEVVLSKTEAKSILNEIGDLNLTLILEAVEKKLIETNNSVNYTKEGLYLFEQSIIQIIFSGRNWADILNLKLPNGEFLGLVMMEVYPEEEIKKDIRLIADKIMSTNSSLRDKIKSVSVFIKKRQFELMHKVIDRCF